MRSTYKQLYYINRRKGCCIIDRVVLPAGRVEQQERGSQEQQTERDALRV